MRVFGNIKTFRMHKENSGFKFEIAGYMKGFESQRIKNILLNAMRQVRRQHVILIFEAMSNKMITVNIKETLSSKPLVLCNISNELYDKMIDMTGSVLHNQSHPMININVEDALTSDRGPPSSDSDRGPPSDSDRGPPSPDSDRDPEDELDALYGEDREDSEDSEDSNDEEGVQEGEGKKGESSKTIVKKPDNVDEIDDFEYEWQLGITFSRRFGPLPRSRLNKAESVIVDSNSYSVHFEK